MHGVHATARGYVVSTPFLSPDGIEDAAAQWVVRRLSGLSSEERAELNTWLAADPRHAAAFATFQSSWAYLNSPRQEGRGVAIDEEICLGVKRRARRRKVFFFTGGVAAAAALVLGFLMFQPTSVTPVDRTTVAVRPDRRTLPDGSVVELNAGAEIAVHYKNEIRGVELVKGEALFEVAKDAMHPFVVTAGNIHVRAVGTAFTVHYQTERVGVLVTEGRVAVEEVTAPLAPGFPTAAAAKPEPVFLDAGGRVEVPVNQALSPALVQPVSNADMAEALSWREKRLEFSDTPLPVAVKLFNQGNILQITVGDAALNHRVITGIFWADDPGTFVRLLEEGFSLKAERNGNAITLRDAKGR